MMPPAACRRVPVSAVENEALNRAIDAAQAGLILQRKPSQLDVHLDLVKAGLVAGQMKEPQVCALSRRSHGERAR